MLHAPTTLRRIALSAEEGPAAELRADLDLQDAGVEMPAEIRLVQPSAELLEALDRSAQGGPEARTA